MGSKGDAVVLTKSKTGHSRLWRTGEGALTIALAVVGGIAVWRWSAPPTAARASQTAVIGAQATPQSLDGRLGFGRLDAPVAVVVVSDFQCPFCAKFAAETIPALRRSFVDTGRIALYYRHFPLDGHLLAEPAAELAECASRKGQFWQVHDSLFSANTRLTSERLADIAATAGLEGWRPGLCSTGNVVSALNDDHRWALDMGLRGTPFILFAKREPGGSLRFYYTLSGAQPLDELQDVIERLEELPTRESR